MRVVVESILPCDPDLAWDEVQTSRLLREVISPLAAVWPMPGEELPEIWSEGADLRVRMFLFRVLPLGARALRIERVDPARREIQSRESDALIARWDHLIRIEPAVDGHCRYRDEIEIEAGWRTLPVWLFARWFYRHRRRRWQAVARRLAEGPRLDRGAALVP